MSEPSSPQVPSLPASSRSDVSTTFRSASPPTLTRAIYTADTHMFQSGSPTTVGVSHPHERHCRSPSSPCGFPPQLLPSSLHSGPSPPTKPLAPLILHNTKKIAAQQLAQPPVGHRAVALHMSMTSPPHFLHTATRSSPSWSLTYPDQERAWTTTTTDHLWNLKYVMAFMNRCVYVCADIVFAHDSPC